MKLIRTRKIIYIIAFYIISLTATAQQEDYNLWLQYKKIENPKIVSNYQTKINGISP